MDNASSAADFIQASRILKINSPLGEDQLLPERVTIEEGISSLFEIRLVARTKKEQIKPEELIGRLLDVSVEVQQGDGEDVPAIRRPFNGLVTELNEGPPITRGLRSYAMVLRPQMWLLTRRSDCRIWMDKTSIEIAEILFSEHGIPAPDTSGVITAPPKQHYSVQFNERDLDYLCRRFEEDGLFYWFSHEDGEHKLHVADTANGWLGPSASAQGEKRVRLAQGSSDRNHINEWARRFSYVPGQRAGADWNFETPRMVPGTMTPSLVQMPDATKRELYEYPARISSVAEAERAQKLRAQASEADHDRVFGASTSRIIETGRRFTPYEVAHPDHAYEEHVIIKSIQTVVDRSYETNSNEPEYRNEFEAVPSRVPMTPHRETKRPRIEGTQVAIVAGPEGEEIHPDQYGRIKVWFPWDRKAKKDGSDTCWVRVAQNWAGSTWGGQVIPRIGMEVMIAYVDGDPDRPLVTGVVPNAMQQVPYELPANKTKSTFRTNTHKGVGFNELSFEDDKGREEIYIHGQKDRNEKIRNNHTEQIDNNWVQSIGHNKSIEVRNNHHEVVGGNMMVTVGPSGIGRVVNSLLTSLVSGIGDVAKNLGFPGLLNPGEGNLSLIVEKNKTESVGIFNGVNVGVGMATNVGKSYSVNAGTRVNLMSNDTMSFTAQNSTTVHSGGELHLTCGKSNILMHEDGTVVISGSKLFLDFDEAEINGEQRVVINGGRIDLN
ncbi:type VI secretion system tip protein VgrG [Rhizobiales bacterium RZME27]|uniref:Type VI secretion system tip protein VgrG n=1 Tax=Endobacterium cereale TaxID=2663029 RepID=A0A6A8A7T7_9HYPH|nr:type VI secretion system tip protein TssI/VgrG [Endobacterium cereale]MQY45326.1 type VI secretion system tip protein VgrG [Endobacterium cereale]